MWQRQKLLKKYLYSYLMELTSKLYNSINIKLHLGRAARTIRKSSDNTVKCNGTEKNYTEFSLYTFPTSDPSDLLRFFFTTREQRSLMQSHYSFKGKKECVRSWGTLFTINSFPQPE